MSQTSHVPPDWESTIPADIHRCAALVLRDRVQGGLGSAGLDSLVLEVFSDLSNSVTAWAASRPVQAACAICVCSSKGMQWAGSDPLLPPSLGHREGDLPLLPQSSSAWAPWPQHVPPLGSPSITTRDLHPLAWSSAMFYCFNWTGTNCFNCSVFFPFFSASGCIHSWRGLV